MKKLVLLFWVAALLSNCTKEKIIEPISGTWTIVETNDARAGYIQVKTYAPSSEITLQFGENNNLILTGNNPGVAESPLWEFDKYQVLQGNFVKLYQSTGSKQMKVYYEIEGNLFLNYPDRHGYEEKFLRIR